MGAEKKDDDLAVTLWGVMGSGKSWLVNAFAKELEFYSRLDEFDYELCLANEQADECEKLIAAPTLTGALVDNTKEADDRAFVFKRKCKDDFSGSLAHQISSFCHSVVVHDNAGKQLEKAVSKSNSEADPAIDIPLTRIAIETLKRANGLILMLDPTTVEDTPVKTVDTNLHSRKEYANWMKNLFEKIDKKTYIALCLSKADIIPFYLPPAELVEAIWGKEMTGVINNYANKQGKIIIKHFRVSAAGTYLDDNQKRLSNFDPKNNGGSIKEADKWVPLNTAAPFFWIFQEFEKQKLQRSSSPVVDRARLYIPYPEPRTP